MATPALSGTLRGGQQPISGAAIRLIAAGASGYGSSGTTLGSAITDSDGTFTFGPLLPCPTADGLTYLESSGGDAGFGVNSSAAEMAVVGSCSNLSPSLFVSVTEVTTVAAAYALSQFAAISTTNTSIGTSPGNTLGLKNAGSTFALLVDTGTGRVRDASSRPGVTLPVQELNTLADVIASCVNSNGSSSATCESLFSYATPLGGTPPIDTFQAALDIALNPGNQAANLWSLVAPNAPYQPTLSSAPTDFALGIVYSGGAFAAADTVHGVDVDAAGNVWAVAAGSGTNGKQSSIVEISPLGEYLSPPAGFLSNGLSDPQTLAVTPAGNIEIASQGNNEIFELSANGTSSGTFSVSNAASLNAPVGVAVDNRNGSTWITDTATDQSTHIDASGDEILTSSPMSACSAPLGVAIDGFGDVWIACSDQNSPSGSNSALHRISPSGNSPAYGGPVRATGTGTYPFDVALDHAGNAWLAQYAGIGKYDYDMTMLSPPAGFASNADNSPFSLVVDGLDRVLAANSNLNDYTAPGTVTVFSNDGTLLSTDNGNHGYSANGTLPINIFGPKGAALDSAGNMWIAGRSGSEALLVELIGIAAPVLTPLSVANSPNMLGTRP